MADCVQQVYGVPGKTLYALGEDDVNVPGLAFSQHPIELFALLSPGPGDAVIGKDASVFPFRILLDQGAVVAYLCGKRVLHPLGVHRHSGVGGNPFSLRKNRRCSLKFFYSFQEKSLLSV